MLFLQKFYLFFVANKWKNLQDFFSDNFLKQNWVNLSLLQIGICICLFLWKLFNQINQKRFSEFSFVWQGRERSSPKFCNIMYEHPQCKINNITCVQAIIFHYSISSLFNISLDYRKQCNTNPDCINNLQYPMKINKLHLNYSCFLLPF